MLNFLVELSKQGINDINVLSPEIACSFSPFQGVYKPLTKLDKIRPSWIKKNINMPWFSVLQGDPKKTPHRKMLIKSAEMIGFSKSCVLSNSKTLHDKLSNYREFWSISYDFTAFRKKKVNFWDREIGHNKNGNLAIHFQ